MNHLASFTQNIQSNTFMDYFASIPQLAICPCLTWVVALKVLFCKDTLGFTWREEAYNSAYSVEVGDWKEIFDKCMDMGTGTWALRQRKARLTWHDSCPYFPRPSLPPCLPFFLPLFSLCLFLSLSSLCAPTFFLSLYLPPSLSLTPIHPPSHTN